ncbi:MAG: aminoglycoside phosphotransferase family protein [Lachnospiraceae bacterium]|nr:aminoglycoside phosphotransferase family protein [Lachnospiraceae bacterium]
MGVIDTEDILKRVASQFQAEGSMEELVPYGSGHINDTFRLTCRLSDGGCKRYILQKMNTSIFKNTAELMENVEKVTSFLRKKIIEAGGNPERETLNLVPAADGRTYLESEGEFWRMYIFIENATSFDEVKKPEDFYNSAVSFGNFQRLLADYPAETLHETIMNFHNTADRFANFKKAVKEDVCGRAKAVQDEIDFVLAREKDTHVICDALAEKRIPLRVTHNDTKLNNIMIDDQTGKGLCVIDLDTVMPGSSLYDYGDSIRFGASTGAEDEPNLELISLDLGLFDIYTKGYLEGCGGSLTKEEIELFPMGAKLMTFECGMRFLADYLQGDVYFKIHREGHNLDRARTQFKLVSDMESKWEEMTEIVRKYSGQALEK